MDSHSPETRIVYEDTPTQHNKRRRHLQGQDERMSDEAAKRKTYKTSHSALGLSLELEEQEDIQWEFTPSVSLAEGDDQGSYANLERFARRLNELNTPCTFASNVIKTALIPLRARKKLEVFVEIERLLKNPPTSDADLVKTRPDLNQVLASSFRFVKAKKSAALITTGGYDIPSQINHMSDKKCAAHRPAGPPINGSNTVLVTMKDLQRIFIEGKAERIERGLNCLDLRNLSGNTFKPREISNVDLVAQITRKCNKSRNDRGGEADRIKEWMLLSHKMAVSPFHADAGGYCAVVIGLSGTKYWYWLKGDWSRACSQYRLRDRCDVTYDKGVCCTKLEEGDFIIQAPGTIHAVVTPQDSLAAGYFFYTAAHFPRTIKCVRLELAGKLGTNDDLKDKDFQNLSLVVRHISNKSMDDIFKDLPISETWIEVGDLLEQEGLIRRNNDTEVWENVARGPANNHESKVSKHRREFLNVCLNWWWEQKNIVDRQE